MLDDGCYYPPRNVSFKVVSKNREGFLPLRRRYFLGLERVGDEFERKILRQVRADEYRAANVGGVANITMYLALNEADVVHIGSVVGEMGVAGVIVPLEGRCQRLYFTVGEAIFRKEGVGAGMVSGDGLNLRYNNPLA